MNLSIKCTEILYCLTSLEMGKCQRLSVLSSPLLSSLMYLGLVDVPEGPENLATKI